METAPRSADNRGLASALTALNVLIASQPVRRHSLKSISGHTFGGPGQRSKIARDWRRASPWVISGDCVHHTSISRNQSNLVRVRVLLIRPLLRWPLILEGG